MFEVLSADVHFPRIQHIGLFSFAADYTSFIQFLAAHQTTLKDVGFSDIYPKGCSEELSDDELNNKVLAALSASGISACREMQCLDELVGLASLMTVKLYLCG